MAGISMPCLAAPGLRLTLSSGFGEYYFRDGDHAAGRTHAEHLPVVQHLVFRLVEFRSGTPARAILAKVAKARARLDKLQSD